MKRDYDYQKQFFSNYNVYDILLNPQDIITKQTQQEIFNSITNHFIGNQHHLNLPDHSIKFQFNPSHFYPLNSIGKIITIYPQLKYYQLIDLPFGTGTLIHPRVVLTVAHNVYLQQQNLKAQFLFFQIQTPKGGRQLIKVQQYAVHKLFTSQKRNQIARKYDIAILILQKNSYTQNIMQIPSIKLDYKYQKYPNNEMLISGYPKNKNLNNKNSVQYCEQRKIAFESDVYLFYLHSTQQGHSGSPIFMRQIDQQGNSVYNIVGVHKGFNGFKNYGISLSRIQKIINQMFNKQINNLKSSHQSSSINKESLLYNKLIQQQQDIQRDLKKKDSQLIWTKLVNINNQPIKLIDFILPNPQYDTFQYQLNEFLVTIKQVDQRWLVLGHSVWIQIVQDFKKLSLNKNQINSFIMKFKQYLQFSVYLAMKNSYNTEQVFDRSKRLGQGLYSIRKSALQRMKAQMKVQQQKNKKQLNNVNNNNNTNKQNNVKKQETNVNKQQNSVINKNKSTKLQKEQIDKFIFVKDRINEFRINYYRQQNNYDKYYNQLKYQQLVVCQDYMLMLRLMQQNKYLNELLFYNGYEKINKTIFLCNVKPNILPTCYNLQLYITKGDIMFKYGYYNRAIKYYTKVKHNMEQNEIENYLYLLSIQIKLGQTYEKLGQYMNSIQSLKKVLYMIDNNESRKKQFKTKQNISENVIYIMIANSYCQLGNKKQAQQILDKGLQKYNKQINKNKVRQNKYYQQQNNQFNHNSQEQNIFSFFKNNNMFSFGHINNIFSFGNNNNMFQFGNSKNNMFQFNNNKPYQSNNRVDQQQLQINPLLKIFGKQILQNNPVIYFNKQQSPIYQLSQYQQQSPINQFCSQQSNYQLYHQYQSIKETYKRIQLFFGQQKKVQQIKSYNIQEQILTLNQLLKIQQSKQIKNQSEICKILADLGAKYLQANKPDQSINNYLKALKITQSISQNHNDLYKFKIITGLGQAFMIKGQLPRSLSYFLEGLNILKKTNDKNINNLQMQRLLNSIGVNYKRQGNNNKALQYYSEAQSLKQQINLQNSVISLQIYTNLAQVYRQLGQYNKCMQYHKKCKQIVNQYCGSNTLKYAQVMIEQGNTLYELSNFQQVIQKLKPCFKIYKNLNAQQKSLQYFKSILLLNKCRVELGQHKQARQQLQKNKQLYKKKYREQDYICIGMIQTIGKSYLQQNKQFNKAQPYFIKANQISQKLFGQYSIKNCNIILDLATLYICMYNRQKAIKYIKKAKQIIYKLGNEDNVLQIQLMMVQVQYYSVGYYKQMQKQIKYKSILEQAFKIFQSKWIILQKIFDELGDCKTTNQILFYYNIGIQYNNFHKYNKAIQMYNKFGQLRKKIRSCRVTDYMLQTKIRQSQQKKKDEMRLNDNKKNNIWEVIHNNIDINKRLQYLISNIKQYKKGGIKQQTLYSLQLIQVIKIRLTNMGLQDLQTADYIKKYLQCSNRVKSKQLVQNFGFQLVKIYNEFNMQDEARKVCEQYINNYLNMEYNITQNKEQLIKRLQQRIQNQQNKPKYRILTVGQYIQQINYKNNQQIININSQQVNNNNYIQENKREQLQDTKKNKKQKQQDYRGLVIQQVEGDRLMRQKNYKKALYIYKQIEQHYEQQNVQTYNYKSLLSKIAASLNQTQQYQQSIQYNVRSLSIQPLNDEKYNENKIYMKVIIYYNILKAYKSMNNEDQLINYGYQYINIPIQNDKNATNYFLKNDEFHKWYKYSKDQQLRLKTIQKFISVLQNCRSNYIDIIYQNISQYKFLMLILLSAQMEIYKQTKNYQMCFICLDQINQQTQQYKKYGQQKQILRMQAFHFQKQADIYYALQQYDKGLFYNELSIQTYEKYGQQTPIQMQRRKIQLQMMKTQQGRKLYKMNINNQI